MANGEVSPSLTTYNALQKLSRGHVEYNFRIDMTSVFLIFEFRISENLKAKKNDFQKCNFKIKVNFQSATMVNTVMIKSLISKWQLIH